VRRIITTKIKETGIIMSIEIQRGKLKNIKEKEEGK
jgi:hypothetical protein